MGPGRLHALIDGVFAIALTLLVLDLPKPAHSTRLVHDLLHQWPSYVAYLVSFVTIGLLWIEHHGMMSAVRSINRRFLERTLAFLLFISIIPWPTALASNYADQGVPQARAAAVLYAATMLMMGLSFTWGWRYLSAHPELVAEPARPAFPAGARRALLGGLVYFVAIAVAFLSPIASFAIDAFVAVYFAASKSKVPGLIVRSADADGSNQTPGTELLPSPHISGSDVLLAAQELAQLPGFVQHVSFPGAETGLKIPKLKIDDNLAHAGKILAGELLQVELVPA